jgi:hypothetical protein
MSNSPPQNAARSPPRSPRRAQSSRASANHTPIMPSRLRESVAIVSQRSPPASSQDLERLTPLTSPLLGSTVLSAEPTPLTLPTGQGPKGTISEPSHREADARTHLLEDYHKGAVCGAKHCTHGTFSPHLRAADSGSSNTSVLDAFGGRDGEDINEEDEETRDRSRGWIGDTFADGLFGGIRRGTPMSTTNRLAKKHGVRNQRVM